MAHIAYNDAALLVLLVTDRYTHEMRMVFLFEELGLNAPERNRLYNDNLTSIGDMVDQYGYDTKSFLKNEPVYRY